MTQALQLGAALTAILLVAALLVVWSRKTTWLRAAAIPLALLAAMGAGVATISTLGFAVPLINGVTAPAGKIVVLSAKMIKGVGIFATLDLPDVPRLYWLPWDTKMAEKLQEAQNAPDSGGVTMTVPPFEFSWGQPSPDFQPMPQPKFLPDKPPAPPPAPSFDA